MILVLLYLKLSQMNGRRKFIKTSGMGTAGLLLTPWESVLGNSLSSRKQPSFKSGGIDLTDPSNSDALKNWGYINVLSYGAVGDGVTDDTAALQAAINAGFELGLGVLFPQKTYIISNTLYCDKIWPNTNFPRKCHILVGDESNGGRPIIKLASGSLPLFDNLSTPRAMVVYANYLTITSEMKTLEEYRALDPIKLKQGTSATAGTVINSTANIFDEVIWGINFDCSEHVGAVGLFYSTAQKSIMFNVKVKATNAHTGIWGVPGRNSGAVNIEVEGGRIGLFISDSVAGTTIAGLKLYGQTDQALKVSDFCPACIVGFHIKMDKIPFIITTQSWGQTAVGTIALIDGVFESSVNGTVVNNALGKSLYARNVYVKGANNFIKSGAQTDKGGTGTWFRVNEYSYTDQSTNSGSKFNTWSIINGVKNQQTPAEPIVNIENDVASPPDFIKMHTYDELPYVTFRDSSQTICITDAPYGAVAGSNTSNGPDCWDAIQRAIDDASATGKVICIPKGVFYISKTLTLNANTKIVGIGCKREGLYPLSTIQAMSPWQNIQGNEALLTTVDDPDAETFLYGFNLVSVTNVKRHIHWRAGKKSTMINLSFDQGVAVDTTIYFSGNGGGRHFLLEPQTQVYNSVHRHVYTDATTQPLSWYGCNLEAGGSTPANMELVNSQNIRIYGIKREGATPTLIVNNCENVAVYGQGAMREGLSASKVGYVQIKGDSNGILMPLILVQAKGTTGAATLIESLTGEPTVSVTYPEGLSIYKRGEIDDTKMYYHGYTKVVTTEKSIKNIYPTFTSDIVNISGLDNIEKISMIDMNGRIVRVWNSHTASINISDCSVGLYFLEVIYDYGKKITKRVIKY